MLQRHIEVGQDYSLSHEPDQIVNVWIRIDVVQANPNTQTPQMLSQIYNMITQRSRARKICPVTKIYTVGTRVL